MPILRNAITLSVVNDGAKGDAGKGVQSTTRYYCLEASSEAPAKPTTNPPDSKWTTTEPNYTSGNTSYLYITDLTVYTDSTFLYSDVSLSSSYEAAKAAYAKAVNAETEIEKTNEAVALRATKNEVTETLKGYATTTAMNSAIEVKANEITSMVETNYSTTTQMNSAIQQKADAITSSVNETLSDYSTTTQMNSAIEQKANEITSTVEANYSTTAEMNSAIEQKANAITSSVNETLSDYSTTTQMNSAIEQKANEISSSVSTTYATKTEVTSAVDGIQVGGTNLIPGTADWKYAVTSTSHTGRILRGPVWLFGTGEAEAKQLANKAVTMSYTVSNTGAWTAYSDIPGQYAKDRFGGYLTAHWKDSTGTISGTKDTWLLVESAAKSKGDFRRVQQTAILAPPTGYDTLVDLGFTMELSCYPTDGNTTWIFERPKVELGNKATDWSPAPQDAENRISTAETQIAQNATDISLRATKTELDGLQIGGVNLMLDTKAYGGNGGANYTVAGALQTETYNGFAVRRGENTSDANALQFKMAYAFQPGESYTLSFWGKGSGVAQALITGYTYPCASVSSEGTAGTDAGGANTFNVTSDWKRYWVTFTMGAWATVPTGKELWLRARNSTSGRVLDVCGLKLERGSRATDWSPSPEDPARGVKTSSITVDADSIDIETGGSLNLNGADVTLSSGATMAIESGGSLNLNGADVTLNSAASMTIQSGGTFQLTAPQANTSYIRFGDADTPNFSASASGDVVARTLRIAGMWPLLAAMAGLKVSVAQATPSGSNILWIKPSATSRKTYAYQQSGSDVYIVGEDQQVTLAQADTSTLSGSTFSYTVTLPISEYMGKTHSNVQVHAYLINGSKTIDMGYKQITLYAWVNTTLSYTATSSINLASAAGNVVLKIDTRKDGNKYTTSGIRVQRGGNIGASIVSDQGTATGAQSCQVFYIP